MISKIRKLFGKPPKVLAVDAPPVPPEHVQHIAEPNPPPAPSFGRRMTALPSKSRLLKLLREAYGTTARFQTHGDGTVQIWIREAGVSDMPIAEVKARDPKGQPAIYWIATCAAFRRLGFALEHYPDRIEVVPFNAANPKHKNSEILDA